MLAPEKHWEAIEYRDPARGVVRLAYVGADGLEECLFFGPPGSLPDAGAVIGLFAKRAPLDDDCRLALLGGALDKTAPTGRIVCTCFQVGIETIRAAIESEGIEDVRALGRKLRAGTNCGSCIPELKEILIQSRAALAAE